MIAIGSNDFICACANIMTLNLLIIRLPYSTIFGGVSAITREHFERLNGFSNSFWGWGGEDDDMSNRIRYHNLHISRYPLTIARYTMLTHAKDKPSPNRYYTFFFLPDLVALSLFF